ncbi:hypothetical protein A3Q56_05636 [Intoshia linei]|uniref:EGF-like domain-containing protein n=1 Tax=Intoshia linei TaxID=1819745 RepID=A0A177AZ43_9BILA|nr:hypothetical protein A3Q56_05636 [Intoshia linei]
MCNDDSDVHPLFNQDFHMQQMHEINWIVAAPSTPANMFHLIRRQMALPFRKPLIVMTPKSLLRHPDVRSSFKDIITGTEFQRIIPETGVSTHQPFNVKKLIFCTSKVYYDLFKERNNSELNEEIAICRVEQISPFPYDMIKKEIELFPFAKIEWVQEEHKNMGAWSYIQPRFNTLLSELNTTSSSNKTIGYIGRSSAAATATGNKAKHFIELNQLLQYAMKTSIIYSYTGCLIKKLNGELCPNPCKRNPCNFIYQSLGNVCTIINGGFYNYDYTCECKFGYEWNSQREECSRIDVCKDENSCIKNNSISCQVLTPEEGNFKCICQPQFMGLQCKLPRDPCIWPNVNQIVGTEKCGYNGKCIGSIGTDLYYCICHSGYTDNPSNSYSDCQVYEAMCEGILCINGVCVASTNNAICVCNQGYSDSKCATKLPYWLNWETWDDCYPRCGTNRKQNRTRSCSEKGNYCVGTRYEWKTCNDTICLVNGIFGNWNDWLPCDHNCGTGEQVSTRSCIYNTDLGEEGWGKPCPVKKSTRRRYCNVHACVNSIRQRLFELAAETIRRFEGKLNVKSTGWRPWNDWSNCDVECGFGDKYKVRSCAYGTDKCIGVYFESQRCFVECFPQVNSTKMNTLDNLMKKVFQVSLKLEHTSNSSTFKNL